MNLLFLLLQLNSHGLIRSLSSSIVSVSLTVSVLGGEES